MNIYGFPTLTIRDAETGEVKGEISIKNTPSIHTKNYMSLKSAHLTSRIGDIDINDSSYRNSSHIYVSPFIKAKSSRFPGGLSQSYNSGNELNGVKIIERCSIDSSVSSISAARDDEQRQTLIFKGFLPAPSTTREIGTIYLCKNISSSYTPVASDIMFFTSLDEVFVQDSATVVDIEYKIIFEKGTTTASHALNEIIASMYTRLPLEKSLNGLNIESDTSPGGDSTDAVTSIFGTIKHPDKYNGVQFRDIRPQAGFVEISPVDKELNVYRFTGEYHGNGVSSFMLSYRNQNICGELVKSVYAQRGARNKFRRGESEINAISEIDTGTNISTVYIKNGKSDKPFLDTTNAGGGTTDLEVASESKQKRLPEYFTLKVKKGGTPASAEIDVYKSYVTGFWTNSFNQVARYVPHLSSIGSGLFYSTQYKHDKGDIISSLSVPVLMYDFNVLRISRPAFMITSVTNDDYEIYDSTNLPESGGEVLFTGYAFDINRKAVLVGCSKNGLYKITGNLSDGGQLSISKVQGISKVYAMNHNTLGGVTLITDAGIKISKDFGESWTDILSSEMTNILNGADIKTISGCATDYSSGDLNTIVATNHFGGSKLFWVSTASKAGTDTSISNKMLIGYCFSHIEENWTTTRDSSRPDDTHIGYYIRKLYLQNYMSFANGKFVISVPADSSYSYMYHAEYGSRFESINIDRSSLGVAVINLYKDKLYLSTVHSDSDRRASSADYYGTSDSQYISGLGEYRSTLIYDGSRFARSNGKVYLDSEYMGSYNSCKTYSSCTDYATLLQLSSSDNYEYQNKGMYPLSSGANVFYIVGISENKISSDTNSTSLGKCTFTSTGNGFESNIDGLKIKIPSGSENLQEGDVYTFIRYDGYVNENTSTATILYENSIHNKVKVDSHNITISKVKEELPFRYIASSYGDVEIHKKVENRSNVYLAKTSRLSSPSAPSSYNSVQVGGFKMDIDLTDLSGAWVVEFAQINANSAYIEGQDNRKLLIWKDDTNIKCGFYNHSGDSSQIASGGGNVLVASSPLSIKYDSSLKSLTVSQNDRQVASSNIPDNNGYPIIAIRMKSAYMGKNGSGGIIITDNPQRLTTTTASSNGFGVLNDKAVIRFPKMTESFSGMYWTPLGVKNRKEGIYDDKFVEVSRSDLSIKIGTSEDDAVPAKIHWVRSMSVPINYNNGYGHKVDKVQNKFDLSAGEVIVYMDIGTVGFSDEDAGKKAFIDYAYYQDVKLGYDETINE